MYEQQIINYQSVNQRVSQSVIEKDEWSQRVIHLYKSPIAIIVYYRSVENWKLNCFNMNAKNFNIHRHKMAHRLS